MVATPISSTLQRQQGQQETLSRCLEDAINTLSAEQIYHHPSHNFKHSGDRLAGRMSVASRVSQALVSSSPSRQNYFAVRAVSSVVDPPIIEPASRQDDGSKLVAKILLRRFGS
jgi:hypothetical protein